MHQPAWQFECSVEAEAQAEFAWQFWTDVANWKELEPGIEFELRKPERARELRSNSGCRGKTLQPIWRAFASLKRPLRKG